MDLYQGLVLGLLTVGVVVLAGIFTRLGRIGQSLEASNVHLAGAPGPQEEAEPAVVAANVAAAADTNVEEAASEAWPVSDGEWELVPVADQEADEAEVEPVAVEEYEPEREPERVDAQEREADPVNAQQPEAERKAERESEPVASQEAEPHEAEPVAVEEPEVEHEPEPVAVEEPEVEHEPEPVAVEEPEVEHEPEPVAAQDAEHEAEQVDTEEPEEKPFRRDGRWWFRRDDELLVYDDASGEWVPSDTGPGESSFVITRDPAPAATVDPDSHFSHQSASVATKERDAVSDEAGQVFPEGDATEQLAVSSFWKCPTCGAVNGSTAGSCRMCFAARP